MGDLTARDQLRKANHGASGESGLSVVGATIAREDGGGRRSLATRDMRRQDLSFSEFHRLVIDRYVGGGEGPMERAIGVFMATTQAVESIHAVIEKIVSKNEGIASFWRDAEGWAPDEAAALLRRSRLDRQVSLSRTLVLWVEPASMAQAPDAEGRLILGWANLGSLVEGSLKWFLSVYLADYIADVDAIRTQQGDLKDPDGLYLETVRTYFARSVWSSTDSWDAWILSVQQRRNAIHFYKDRPIGTHDELVVAIRRYWDFLQDLEGRVPYPDEVYRP